MRKRLLQLVMVMCVVAAPLRAQIKTVGDGTTALAKAEHLTVELLAEPARVFDPTQENIVALHFVLDEGWHIYWQNPGDAGGATHVEWVLPKGITAGPLLFPVPKRLPLGPLMDYGYEGDVVLPSRFTISPTAKSGAIQAKVDWLVCREVCIPGKAFLGLKRGVAPRGGEMVKSVSPQIEAAMQSLPQPLPKGTMLGWTGGPGAIEILLGMHVDHAEFYPFDQDVIANAAPQVVEMYPNGTRIRVQTDKTLTKLPATLHGLIKVSDKLAYEFDAPMSETRMTFTMTPGGAPDHASGDVTLFAAIGLAFLGGIILNLMPCVFPVLFLKGLALVQGSGEERSRLRKHGVVYTLGILVSFWVIVAALLVLRASGAKLGWGFQLQSPAFIAVLCVGIFFFALSLAGMFDLGLTLTSAGGELAQQPGYAGSFFTGVLATVVATPCTAPLMGAAIGFALAASAWTAFVIFTAVALGLALPYLLLSFNPAWTRLLPKPGAWMEILKQVTAVPLFATVIWLAWVFGTLRGLDQMARLLIALLFAAMAAWVMGRWPARLFASVVAGVLLVCGLAVPLAHTEAASADWVTYSPDALEQARAAGKPVFVDFTAAWCLSCHVNEELVLDSAEVKAKFASSGIVLMRADWTKYDPAITAALASVNRSGVPTYVIFPTGNKEPDVLPELLSKGVVLSALERDLK